MAAVLPLVLLPVFTVRDTMVAAGVDDTDNHDDHSSAAIFA